MSSIDSRLDSYCRSLAPHEAAFGFTLLAKNALYGNQEGVRALLQKGADVNEQDRQGRTALFWAVMGQQTEMVKFLLENPSVRLIGFDSFNMTSLHKAVELKNKTIVELLLKDQRVNVDYINKIDDFGYTILHTAAEKADTAMVECLLSDGRCDVNALSGDLDVVNSALEKHKRVIGPNIQKIEKYQSLAGSTALNMAVASGDESLVNLLSSDQRISRNILDTDDQ